MKPKRPFTVIALTLLAAGLLGACSGGPPPERVGPKPLHFVVFGDSRPVGTGAQPYVLTALAGHVAEEKPSVILHTGDVIDGYGLTESDMRMGYREFREAAARFGAPTYTVPGNHDVFDSLSERVYTEEMGPLRRVIQAGGCVFFLLDTEELGSPMRLSDEQYYWLERQLQRGRESARAMFVVLHRPLNPVGPHKGDSLDAYPAHRDALHDLLVAYGVKAVFSGHEHLYARVEKAGLIEYITGGGGAPLHGTDENAKNHYLRVTVEGPYEATEELPAEPLKVSVQPVMVSDPVQAALENIIDGDPNLSIEIMRRGVPAGHQHPDVELVVGMARMARGERNQGREMIGNVISARPRSALTAGDMLLFLGWAQEAAGAFRRGLEARPRDPRLFEGMAEAFFALGNKPKAFKSLDAALKCQRSYASPYYRMMKHYLADDEPDRARTAAENYVKLWPFGRRAGEALDLLGRSLPPAPKPPRPGGAEDEDEEE